MFDNIVDLIEKISLGEDSFLELNIESAHSPCLARWSRSGIKAIADSSGGGLAEEVKIAQTVGAVGSEPAAPVQPTLGEIEVSRLGGNARALWSLTQETPAITPRRLAVGDFI